MCAFHSFRCVTLVLRFLCLSLLCVSSISLAADSMSLLKKIPAVKSDIADHQLLTSVGIIEDKLVTVGAYGHILVSQDNGESWQQANVPVNLLLTGVHFPTKQHGWVVGHEGVILHSADGGMNWELQHANPMREISDEEYDNMSDADFAKLPQLGAPILDVHFNNEQVGFVVGAYGLFLCTTDAGKNWEDCADRIDNADGWHLNAIADNGGGVLYIAGEKGMAFRSDDNGENWEAMEVPYEGSFFGVLPLKQSDEVIIFGLQGKTFRSTDRGKSWSKVSHNAKTGIMDGVQTNQNDVILVGNSGAILVSSDRGAAFSLKTLKSRRHIVSAVSLSNGKQLMVGQGGVIHSQ